jgi:hypothetical protein
MSQRYIGGLIYNPPGGYSGYFDGSGDYLTTPANSAFTLGTGDYTLELWVFLTAVSREHALFDFRANASASGSHYITTSDKIGIWNGSSLVGGTGSSVPANTWSHIAYVRSSGSVTAYLNGVAQWTASYADNLTNNVAYVCGSFNGLNTLQGYASNARIVKGTAVYTTAFTPPNGPLQNITNTSLLTCRYPTFVDGSNNAFTITVNGNTTVSTQNPFPLTTLPNPAQGGAGNGIFSMSQYQSLKQQNLWPAIDPYFENTTLLLHGNGTNGAQNNSFVDSSANAFSITRNGDTTQGTFSPFSPTGWSNYFDGSGNGYERFADTGSVLDLPGDFTLEFWVYQNAIATTNGTLNVFMSINTLDAFQFYQDASNAVVTLNGTNVISTATKANLNTWAHYAIVRSGSTVTLYLNGVSAGSGTSSFSITCTDMTIGGQDRRASSQGSAYHGCNAYISNFRVVKGTAVYTGSFTPSTAPLTAISGTSLLACQGNRFIDVSTNALVATVGTSASVQAFSPFQPTSAWSASTNGGSGYFDGTGDYLTAPDNAVFDFGTSAFTIECWVYFNNISGDQYVLSYDTGTTPDQNGINIYSGGWRIGGFNSYLITGSTGLIAQQWIHVAMTRDSNTLRAYINGVQLGTSDVTGVTFDATGAIHIGSIFNPAGSFTLNGYLSGLRITKGGCLYPNGTTFTVPTSPPTTTVSAGTVSLLLNFTNAGIIDSTAKNDLVTVNSAQISTAQSKFGGASMLFDGTTDYLTLQANPDLALGSGDWTVECWVYLNATANEVTVFGSKNYYVSGKNGNFVLRVGNTNVFYVFNGQTAVTNISPSSNWSTGVWTHAAWVRSSGTVTVYRNGVSIGSTANTTDLVDSANGGYIAVNFSNGSLASGTELNGYIDDLRITKGIARYTTNFTPQRSQWQDQ